MQPFAPPEEPSEAAVGVGPVVGAWAGAGMAIGTSVALGLGARGWLDVSLPILVGLVGAACVGVVVAQLEYFACQSRPSTERSTGLTRLWVMGLPISLTVVALLASALFGGRSGAWMPALGLAALAVGLTLFLAPLYSRRALAKAVLAAHRGEEEVARARLIRVSTSLFASRRQRSVAMLNLGRVDLSTGAFEGALESFEAVDHERVRPWAATGASLACLMAGRDGRAAEWLARTGGDAEVASEANALRILLAWRQEGAAAALPLAESIVQSGEAGTLSIGLLAGLSAETGREVAGAPPSAQVLDDLRHGPGRHLDEVRRLLERHTSRTQA